MSRAIGFHRRGSILRTLAVVVCVASTMQSARAGQSPSPSPIDPKGGWSLNGRPASDTPYRRSANGLGGWLLVTDDTDWLSRWETPFENAPHFSEVDSLTIGERVTMLILISNPKRDGAGRVDVACDVRVRRADGTTSIDERGVQCLDEASAAPAGGLSLALPQIVFEGEESDPVGEWILDVTVVDRVRMVKLPLRRVITLERRAPGEDPKTEVPAHLDEISPVDRH